MLKLIDITRLYHHLPMRFTLSVSRGEQVAILGPSGAGKSTLLNLIAGFLTPASGTMMIEGEDHTATPPSRRPVSMLFQENNLFSHLNVQQNIGLGLNPGLKLNALQREKMHNIARQMGLDSLLERLPVSFPAGSDNAWRWRVVWCGSNPYCCSMNRSLRSIRPASGDVNHGRRGLP